MNSDFKDILRSLLNAGVELMVVGGYAVMRYTEPRYTKDLDILINPTEESALRVITALKDFGAPLHDLQCR